MTFKIYVGGQRVESERVLGEAWRTTTVRVEWNGILFEIYFNLRGCSVSYRLRYEGRKA